MSLMACFVLSFFPLDVLDEIWDLIESVSEGFLTYSFPVPRMDDCIDNISQAKYVTTVDLLKGFWQIPLTDRAK